MEPLAELRAWAEQARPVFVVGVPRSGTSALRAALERHPAFRARRPEWAETRVFAFPQLLLDLSVPQARNARRFLFDDPVALAEVERGARALREEGRGPLDWVRHYFRVAQRVRGAARLLEKTPRHLDHVGEIFGAFPEARVICCVRHPVDTYSSYRKKRRLLEERGAFEERHRWLRLSAKGFARKFERWAAAMRRWEDLDPLRFRIVRYERLTADPRAELADLLAFLGEPFDEAVPGGEAPVARDAFGSPRPRGAIAASSKDWRRFLSSDEAGRIERLAAEAMEALGYAPKAAGSRAG